MNVIDGLTGLSAWLDETALAAWMRETTWAVPLVQTVHILAIALVLSSALIVALCSFGLLGRDWRPALWSRRLQASSCAGLAVLTLSGAMLVAGEAARSLLSPIFQAKMLLVILVAGLGAWLARRLGETPGEARAQNLLDRALAVSTVATMMAIISAGRWIAYFA